MDTSQAEFLFSDLYVKIYVMNISTQKKVIKKKTRVCRHDREPSFNETFRFSLSPAGHSLQVTLHYTATILKLLFVQDLFSIQLFNLCLPILQSVIFYKLMTS